MSDLLTRVVIMPQEVAAEFGSEGLGEVNRLMLEMKGT